MFLFGWEEVYFGTNQEVFFKNQNRLRDAAIPFKTKIKDTALRASMNNLNGRSVSLSRGGSSENYYSIYVKKEFAEQARQILRDL